MQPHSLWTTSPNTFVRNATPPLILALTLHTVGISVAVSLPFIVIAFNVSRIVAWIRRPFAWLQCSSPLESVAGSQRERVDQNYTVGEEIGRTPQKNARYQNLMPPCLKTRVSRRGDRIITDPEMGKEDPSS